MLSSNRVIKANHTAKKNNKATIATDYKKTKRVNHRVENEINDKKIVSADKSKELLEEAKKEKEKLMIKAQEEIEKIKAEAYDESYQKAYEEGLKKGREKGYNESFNKGYNDAKSKIELELESKRDQATKMLDKAHQKMKEYEAERKEEFLKLATHMAEKIVHDYIDQTDDGLLALAKPYFYQLDKEEEFVTITVNPKQRKAVEKNLDELKSISPATRFMVLGSPVIEERGMLIESSHSIIDLQIKNQLDQMLEEFNEMERTIDA